MENGILEKGRELGFWLLAGVEVNLAFAIYHKKTPRNVWRTTVAGSKFSQAEATLLPGVLATQTKSLDDGAIAFDVAVVQIVEQTTTLTYQHGQ